MALGGALMTASPLAPLSYEHIELGRLLRGETRGVNTADDRTCLYLDPGFSANLADLAIRLFQIVRGFEVSGRTTPAASTIFQSL